MVPHNNQSDFNDPMDTDDDYVITSPESKLAFSETSSPNEEWLSPYHPVNFTASVNKTQYNYDCLMRYLIHRLLIEFCELKDVARVSNHILLSLPKRELPTYFSTVDVVEGCIKKERDYPEVLSDVLKDGLKGIYMYSPSARELSGRLSDTGTSRLVYEPVAGGDRLLFLLGKRSGHGFPSTTGYNLLGVELMNIRDTELTGGVVDIQPGDPLSPDAGPFTYDGIEYHSLLQYIFKEVGCTATKTITVPVIPEEYDSKGELKMKTVDVPKHNFMKTKGPAFAKRLFQLVYDDVECFNMYAVQGYKYYPTEITDQYKQMYGEGTRDSQLPQGTKKERERRIAGDVYLLNKLREIVLYTYKHLSKTSPSFGRALLQTDGKKLVYQDRNKFLGYNHGRGHNLVGSVLAHVREDLKQSPIPPAVTEEKIESEFLNLKVKQLIGLISLFYAYITVNRSSMGFLTVKDTEKDEKGRIIQKEKIIGISIVKYVLEEVLDCHFKSKLPVVSPNKLFETRVGNELSKHDLKIDEEAISYLWSYFYYGSQSLKEGGEAASRGCFDFLSSRVGGKCTGYTGFGDETANCVAGALIYLIITLTDWLDISVIGITEVSTAVKMIAHTHSSKGRNLVQKVTEELESDYQLTPEDEEISNKFQLEFVTRFGGSAIIRFEEGVLQGLIRVFRILTQEVKKNPELGSNVKLLGKDI